MVEDVTENLEIKDQQRKMSRIIIFGLPEAPPMLKQQDEAERHDKKQMSNNSSCIKNKLLIQLYNEL